MDSSSTGSEEARCKLQSHCSSDECDRADSIFPTANSSRTCLKILSRAGLVQQRAVGHSDVGAGKFLVEAGQKCFSVGLLRL